MIETINNQFILIDHHQQQHQIMIETIKNQNPSSSFFQLSFYNIWTFHNYFLL